LRSGSTANPSDDHVKFLTEQARQFRIDFESEKRDRLAAETKANELQQQLAAANAQVPITLLIYRCLSGSLPGGMRGNAILFVEKLPECLGMAFPLLKCLRTHYGRHCEPFSDQKCTRLQNFAYTLSKFFRLHPSPAQPSAPDARTQTPISACLARQHSRRSCFTKRPLMPVDVLWVSSAAS